MKELKEISKQNPFKVPENYFDEVNRKILSETVGLDFEEQKKGIIRKLRPFFAIAASIAVLVVLSYTAILSLTPSKNSSGLSGISLSEFSDNYLEDVDMLTLEENALSIGLFSEEMGFNKNDIIDYLVLDNIDVYDIYEHL